MSTDGEGETTSPSWIFWAMANVFGGLRSVVDFMWKWGQVPGGTIPMDTLNTLLLGWLAFGLLIIVLAKFLYDKFLSWDQSEDEENEFIQQEVNENQNPPDEGGVTTLPPLAVPIITRKATIVPESLPEHISAPIATGGDPDAVRWVNNILVWFYEGSEGGYIVRNSWNDGLNEYTVGSALETGVLIEILEFLPQCPAPCLTNIIVDCAPNDDITVTCDMTATLYLRIQTTRTQHDVTTESEYACAVRPLRGRLNIAVQTHQCVGFLKFDGWPEINMELEGVRNNTEGLDEEQLQEVLREELTSALRKVALELDFLSRKTFPRFSRERSLPENVIPVGYDALVREHQTHPPSFEPKIPTSRTPGPVRSQKVQPQPQSQSNPPPPPPFLPPPKAAFSNSSGFSLSPEREAVNERKAPLFPDVAPASGGRSTVMAFDQADFLKRNSSVRLTNSFQKEVNERVKPPSPPPRRKGSPPLIGPDFAPGHSPLNRLSMVFSSREKPIDEPNGMAPVAVNEVEQEEEIEEEEEEEVDDVFFQELKGMGNTPMAKSPSPSKSPNRELEYLKESLKEPQWKNPFSKANLRTENVFQPTPQPVQLTSPVGIVGLNGKRLLVKVVKATGVGGDAGVSSCYVVIEMDDPPQKFSTNVVRDSSSPFWDEQFLFDLSDNTLELLFELYDKADNRFVGLGIVGIEELVATPSQRQIIPLQARPYEKDEVTGSLTCEFLFLDRADLPDLTLRKTTTGQTASGKLKTTTYIKPSEEKQPEEEIITSTAGVAETALKDLEGRQGSAPLAPNTRSTLIIHASRKGVEEQYYEEEEDTDYKPGVSADLGSGVMAPTGSGTGTPHRSLGASDSTVPQVGSGSRNSASPSDISRSDNTPSQVPSSPNGLPPDDRGRSRSRRTRDFFGSLRRRFSRSKLRSKSVEPTAVDTLDDRDPLSGRSVSMERAAYGRSRGTLTVPTIMRGRTSPTGGGLGSGDSGSTRSSLSGTSGISSTSTKTYINEASLLVVETLENGVVKHYLVPLSLQRKNKWRKKGTKLHIYNEHTFVAKHLSSSVTCQVCQKGVGRRLGKQGYECRDCSFKCHKPCHVKADIVCPNSTVNSMDLVYVKDERAEKRKRVLSS